MCLYDLYCELLNETQDVAGNSYLQVLAPYIKEIEAAAKHDAVLSGYCKRMRKMLEQKHMMTKGESVGEFAQIFGEAHFSVLCKERKVELERIIERKDTRTPDFRYRDAPPTAHFEVKTLSVVDGGRGIDADLLRSLDANMEIERQTKTGDEVATAISEVQPYGGRGYRQQPIAAVLSTLTEKARQNIKPDQYRSKNTFLVLNLCLIPPATTDNRTLRPAYCDDLLFPTPITGALWMLAFSQPGMLIHGQPEFEGKPCLEAMTEKYGILADKEYSSIAGMLVVVYPLSSKPRIYGLYRGSDFSLWKDQEEKLVLLLERLTGEQWNDDRDTNGWQLMGE